MPAELTLIGMPITDDNDLFRLRRFIDANRYEHDPKELIEIGMPRHGAGWDPLAQCAFGTWELKARLSKCGVFEPCGRISFEKLSAYMSSMLPAIIKFIETGDRLVELYRLHIFMRLFFPKGNFPKGNQLLHILATMKDERGQTWANQLRWFLARSWDHGYFAEEKAAQIRRSFNNRWVEGVETQCLTPSVLPTITIPVTPNPTTPPPKITASEGRCPALPPATLALYRRLGVMILPGQDPDEQ